MAFVTLRYIYLNIHTHTRLKDMEEPKRHNRGTLSLLLIAEAPEQMWIKKGVAKEECTYFQFKYWRYTVRKTLSSYQSWILINSDEQKEPTAERNGFVFPSQIKNVRTSRYDFQDHTNILMLLENLNKILATLIRVSISILTCKN